MSSMLVRPLELVWSLVGSLLNLAGRLFAGIIGLVLILLGVVLSLTVIGSIIGIPMLVLGILLVVRCLF